MRLRLIGSLLFAGGLLCLPSASFAQIGIGVSVNIAPPALPVYEQPVCPGDGYLWTPGYWAWDGDYYWVPDAWVMPPQVGYLWTPGYWGWGGGGYIFNEGYWGESIGFYGGINYGFGYFGHGYEGGRWDNGHFFYNTTLNNVNRSEIHNVYDTRVNVSVNSRVSYNGGSGGVSVRATSQEEAASHQNHIAPVAAQTQRAQAARTNPQQRASADRMAPGGSVAARPVTAVHPKELAPIERGAAPNTGNAKTDQKYQQEQNKLATQQNQERQKLQQQQDKEHAQMTRQKATPERTQQVEQQHQQQTQQMQQNHSQQTQQMQQRQSGGGRGGGGRK